MFVPSSLDDRNQRRTNETGVKGLAAETVFLSLFDFLGFVSAYPELPNLMYATIATVLPIYVLPSSLPIDIVLLLGSERFRAELSIYKKAALFRIPVAKVIHNQNTKLT